MKVLLTTLLLTVPLVFYAQKITNNIKTVKTLNVYGNSKVIIGKIEVNQTLKTKVYLIKSNQSKDSTGVWVSEYFFGNNEEVPLFNANVLLEFDKPVLSEQTRPGTSFSITWGLTEDKMQYYFKAGQINRPFEGNIIFSFQIRSAEKITPVIKGVAGIL
ncbi:MAG: hypothetical protein JSS98_15065 [Bacteroidetes bacterium]|nr:hypothetical protein [Bacteroidota bacterium]